MCGIASIINHPESIAIQRMVKAMHHRGPNDHGTWSTDGVHLGMARLSIIDLSSAGHQPMTTPDGRYTIVFNGEVYNFKELKKQFLSDEVLKSDTDSEVILYLFRKLGIVCLKHLRGMFAFIIWDAKEKTLWGARDRMGIKPLWYYHKNSKLILGSEIKTILASGVVPSEIEQQALRQYFLYGSIQHPLSFIKNVFSIPPASFFRFNNNHLKIESYWSFPTEINKDIKLNKAVNKFKDIYQEAIDLRMISDRTVGIFLSGGLDSVSLLAAQQQKKEKVRTFTIGFDTPHPKFFSEAKQAEKLSSHFGYPNDSISIGAKEAMQDHIQFILSLDQPSIDGLNTYLVSKYSKQFLTVALSGLGGDELMLGYPRNINLFNLISRKFRLPKKITENYIREKLNGGIKSNKYVNAILNRAGGSIDLRLLYWSNRLLNQPWEVNNMLETSGNVDMDLESFYEFDSVNYSSDTFNTISYYEMRSYMLSQLLRDMDAVSMYNSIEVRFPMIDHKLVEYLFTLPYQYKYEPQNKQVGHRTGSTTYASSGIKRLLRLAYKKTLPEGYFDTPKQGFQLPYYKWLIEYNKEEINDCLEDSPLLQQFINHKEIEKSLQKINKDQIDTNIYLLYTLAKWDQEVKRKAQVLKFIS